MSKTSDAYDARLAELQHQLVLIQQAYAREGRSAIIALEGNDAAGKGGIIRRIGWALDPRHLRVTQIGAPDESERREHWLQRFWRAMPSAGQIAVFDRSWYGRVLVERIEGFASNEQWRRAYGEIREFEASLTAEGLRVVKLYLDIDRDTQLKRLIERWDNPAKRWKLTEDDVRNRRRWDDYAEAYADILKRTSTSNAPWTRIDANHKHQARIDAFTEIVQRLGQNLDLTLPEPPALVRHFIEAERHR